jgi:hypothetical protein
MTSNGTIADVTALWLPTEAKIEAMHARKE